MSKVSDIKQMSASMFAKTIERADLDDLKIGTLGSASVKLHYAKKDESPKSVRLSLNEVNKIALKHLESTTLPRKIYSGIRESIVLINKFARSEKADSSIGAFRNQCAYVGMTTKANRKVLEMEDEVIALIGISLILDATINSFV